MSDHSVVGLARLIHDAHYDLVAGEHKYSGSRGGGSVWNILANCATGDHSVAGIGVGGQDARALLTLEDNKNVGIDILHCDQLPNRQTASMHHYQQLRKDGSSKYITTSKCLRCLNRTKPASLHDSKRIGGGPDSFELSPAIFVVDQMTKITTAWSKHLQNAGWTTIVDIGYPGYLRFTAPHDLMQQLRSFSLLVIQRTVSSFLKTKIAPGQEEADVARKLGALILVSDGERGLTAHDGRKGRVREFHIEAPQCDVVDSVGAGDALLGRIISEALSDGHASGPLPDIEQVEEWCRLSMEQVPTALEAVGARGHLGGNKAVLNGEPGASDASSGCPICGARDVSRTNSVRKRKPQPMSRSNLLTRRRRLESVLDGAAIEKCREVVMARKSTVVTGTGGSFAAADAIARILNHVWHSSPDEEKHAPLAVAMRPLELLAMPRAVDRIIGVSYSGRSADVSQAIELVGSFGAEQILVTARVPDEDDDSDHSIDLVSYGATAGGARRAKERGFISIAGAAVPVVLWAGGVEDIDRVREVIRSDELPTQAESIATLLSEHCGPFGDGGLAVIGTGWASAAMADIESKFVEGSLAPITMHETKDFSHGRFISMASPTSLTSGVLVLGVGPRTPYEQLLINTLNKQLGEERVAEIRSNRSGPLAMLELLLAGQSFSVHFGLAKGIDISRPSRFSSDWLSLYRWTDPLLN